MEGDFDYPKLTKSEIVGGLLILLVIALAFFCGRWSVTAPDDATVLLEQPIVLQAKTPLYALAELKMNDLLSTNAWSHTDSDGVTLEQRRLSLRYNAPVGEVLAKGCFTIDSVVKAWLKSPSHRDIITDKSYTKAVILIDRNDTTCYVVGEYSK